MSITLSTEAVSKRISDLLSQMTLDEKLAQLTSYWVYELQTNGELDSQKVENKLKIGIGQITRLGGASTLTPDAAARTANAIQRFLIEYSRLGIPAIIHEECCSGAMILGGTMYPQMIGVASTFQPELAEKMTDVIRKQLRAIGAHQGLAPVLDVSRDPRWGRTEETFGEDPTLVSHFGMAYIRGLQSNDLSQGVMATGKHFIGHSLSQGGLNCAPVNIGQRELWDTFLAPFQAAIRDANLASIMNAYPQLDGEVVAASRNILTHLLRDTLGFDGLVVSDYEAIPMIHSYHYAAENKSAAAHLALHAGIDVELPTVNCYGDPLRAALEAGEINIEFVDTAVSRHLQKKLETGLFDNPYVNENQAYEVFETADQRAFARKLAVKSMVLLKNDGILPLKKTIKTIAIIGPNAKEGRNQLGDYSYASHISFMKFNSPQNSSFAEVEVEELMGRAVKINTVFEGVRDAVSPNTKIIYAKGCDNLDGNRDGFKEALEIANQADVIILALGDRSGMTPDSTSGETRDSVDLKLPGVQEELAQVILSTGKPVVAVLINGRPYALPWLDEKANAILEAWLPGEEGGNAISDILFGDVNPSGKLPVTFPRHVGQLPIFYNYKPSGMYSNWYGDYVSEKVTPLYAFGHGLSYTSFEYSDLSITKQTATVNETVSISLKIKNIGKVAGDEVVQLYIRDEYASLPRPLKELKGYAHVNLGADETQTVTFHLPVNQLAFYDENLALIIESGKIKIMLGSSSADIRLNGEFEIIGEKKIIIQDRVFVCPVTVK